MSLDLHFPGNERVSAQLGQALQRGRLAGSYLFEGAPGAGQEQAAIELAAGVIVGDTDPANPDARRVRRFSHPDLHYVLPVVKTSSRSWSEMSVADIFGLFQAEQGRKTEDPYYLPTYDKKPIIPIRALRELLGILSTKPFEGRGKVLIIRDADLIDAAGQDTLLKTLEEPPPGRVIILLSERPEALRPTVLSRCQRIPFDPLPREALIDPLVERGLTRERAEFLSALADGNLELAIRFAAAEPGEGDDDGENPLLARRESWLDFLELCELGSEREMLDAIQEFVKGGAKGNVSRERADFLGLAIAWYGELLGAGLGRGVSPRFHDQGSRLGRQAGLDPTALSERIRRAEKSRSQILGNVNAQLTFISLFFSFRQGGLARRSA
jgi:DNA polymerase III subunit delta'